MISYTLFKWTIPQRERKSNPFGLITFGGFGEDWKEEKPVIETDASKETLEFVCHVKSPKDVAKQVRKDPTQRYVLFHGEMLDVKIAMPVFVDGKNLDTFESEGWDNAK